MDTLYDILVGVHGLSGLIALVTFWIAAAAKKGAPLHLRAGKVYLLAMLGIVVTAVPMAALIAMRGAAVTAVFLVYLVVITVTGMWAGRRAVRSKRDQAAFRDGMYVWVAAANLIASVAVFAVGLRMSQTLLMGFSAVGLLTGAQMLWRRWRPIEAQRWWMKEHFSAMVGCGVATHIAFLAIGLERLVRMAGIQPPGWYGLIAWFLPLSLAFVAVVWLDRKYTPKAVPPGAMPMRT